MSVNVNACLGYGWIVPHDQLTPTFNQNNEQDFSCADDMLDTDYGYDLVTWLNDYDENSDVFIGVEIPTRKRVADKHTWYYEDITPDELASTCINLLSKRQELQKLYCTVMGKQPNKEATVHLFECTY